MSHLERANNAASECYASKAVTTTAPNATKTATGPAVKQSSYIGGPYYSDAGSAATILTTATTTAHTAASTIAGAAPAERSLPHQCVSQVLKALCSTPGLVALVVVYSVMGALIFPLLEAPQDITKSAAIAKSREDCLRELWIITEKLNVLYERNWTMLVHEQLRRFEGSIVAATRNGAAAGFSGLGGATTTTLGRFGAGNNLDMALEQQSLGRWSFSEALLYSVTVITTIGHGSLTPKTAAGKIATILYALIGVPLMLMCLSSLGALLADALQCTYARICCRLANGQGGGGRTGNTRRGRGNHQRHSDGCLKATSAGVGGGVGGSEHQQQTKQQQQQQQQQQQNDYDSGSLKQRYAGQSSNVLDHKGCKYDAIINEMATTAAEATTGCTGYANIQHNEESCQLLYGASPAKVNHLVVAGSNTATLAGNEQYYQQQQEQQPQPDVMLMTTTTTPTPMRKLSQPQLYGSPQQQQQQLHYQQQQQQQQAYGVRSATSSPQHCFTHPLQTFHIVATAPNGASATQQQQQQQQQQLQMRHYATLQPRQQQHFVAVPSSLIRFQALPAPGQPPPPVAAAATASATGTNNQTPATPPPPPPSLTASGMMMPPNCYQPATATTTATTAIYFPLTTSQCNGGSGQLANNCSNNGTATLLLASAAPTAATASTLVKYHTIQLQPRKPNSGALLGMSLGLGPAASSNNSSTASLINSSDDMALAMALPPPPTAYQTATVHHGVRRAKFLSKPIPAEITTLINDAGCASVELPAGCTAMDTATAAATTATSIAGTEATTTTTITLGESTTTVDIMDDEDEQEQQRMGNCPHGTPSRMPLIASQTPASNGSQSSRSDGAAGHNGCAAAGESKEAARGLINATAASFHRHTLQHFQRAGGGAAATAAGQRKSILAVSRHRGGSTATGRRCAAHAAAHKRAMLTQASGCYGLTASANNTEASDDDDYQRHVQHTKSEAYALQQFNQDTEEDDEEDDSDDENERAGMLQQWQVPISIVLLILICYICLGTVIFALWENWSLIDGAYFCFVTLSTIGYGDFLPERTFHGPQVQLFACCAYLLLGLVLVAMSFSILETQLMWKCRRIAVRLKLAKD